MKRIKYLFFYIMFFYFLTGCSLIKNTFNKECYIEISYFGDTNDILRSNYVIISNKKVKVNTPLALKKVQFHFKIYHVVKNKTINLLNSILKTYPLNESKRNIKYDEGDMTNFLIRVYKEKKLYQYFYFRNYDDGMEFFDKLIVNIEKSKRDLDLIKVFKNCKEEIEYNSRFYRKKLK